MKRTVLLMVTGAILLTVCLAQVGAADLKKVSLLFYTFGDAPKDLEPVSKAINDKLEKDLNCTVKFVPLTWVDFYNHYNLVLASGEPADGIFAATWISYSKYATNNAFVALDDLLPKYAPKLQAAVPKSKWDGVRVNGRIYGVPTLSNNVSAGGLVYREDLRQKYNLPQITNLKTLGDYLSGIQKNVPDMPEPVRGAAIELVKDMFVPSTKYLITEADTATSVTMGLMVADPRKPSELISTFELPEYKAMLKTMKEWADKGFWPRDILSSAQRINQSAEFQNGRVPFVRAPLGQINGSEQYFRKNQPEWKINFFCFNDAGGLYTFERAAGGMTAIPKSSPNPDRALMVIEKFLTDKSYYDLTKYGVKGVNFSVSSEGKLDMAAIPQERVFSLGMWGISDPSKDYPDPVVWAGYNALISRLTKAAIANPYDGFVVDNDPIQTLQTQFMQVYNEYWLPLLVGEVDNVDTAFDAAVKKLKAAGFDDFKAALQKQVAAFIAARK